MAYAEHKYQFDARRLGESPPRSETRGSCPHSRHSHPDLPARSGEDDEVDTLYGESRNADSESRGRPAPPLHFTVRATALRQAQARRTTAVERLKGLREPSGAIPRQTLLTPEWSLCTEAAFRLVKFSLSMTRLIHSNKRICSVYTSPRTQRVSDCTLYPNTETNPLLMCCERPHESQPDP